MMRAVAADAVREVVLCFGKSGARKGDEERRPGDVVVLANNVLGASCKFAECTASVFVEGSLPRGGDFLNTAALYHMQSALTHLITFHG